MLLVIAKRSLRVRPLLTEDVRGLGTRLLCNVLSYWSIGFWRGKREERKKETNLNKSKLKLFMRTEDH